MPGEKRGTKHSAPSGFRWHPIILVVVLLAASLAWPAGAEAAGWRAGVARAVITPGETLWMSGYGGRDRPAEGKLTELWAKALVLEDPGGKKAVLVTLDLIGIDRDLSLAVRRELGRRFGFGLDGIALATSHTHTGPVVGHNLLAMYFLDAEGWARVARYAKRLRKEIPRVVGRALEGMRAADLRWGIGRSSFAVNRRENREADVSRLASEGKLKGPVDHDVPVLAVRASGELVALVVGYACHATVLSFHQWSGDYPGFAQMELERRHPGAVALFWAGCGADQNPLPRRRVELARDYGGQLATAVDRVLAGEMHEIRGRFAAAYDEIDLPFAKLPARETLEKTAQSENRYAARRARLLLETLRRHGKLSATYPYPVQTWRLGPELLFVTLGGEVVVDYSLRIKKELGPTTTWVAAYTNDVMAYIPSRRVLEEGGYEGGGAMVYYGLPSVWAPEVEERIVETVRRQAARLRGRREARPERQTRR